MLLEVENTSPCRSKIWHQSMDASRKIAETNNLIRKHRVELTENISPWKIRYSLLATIFNYIIYLL